MATPEETVTTDAVAEAPVTDTPTTETTPDPFDAGGDTFDRAYVEKLRNESANYRTRHKPYEETFGGYSDEDREVWFEAARRFAADPKDGGEYLKQIADAVLAEYQEPAPADPDDENRPLTVAEFNRMTSEAKAQAAQEAEIGRIEQQAKGLGYDIESPEYTTLLTIAARLPSGDLAEAHAQMEARDQAKFDARLAQMKEAADGAPVVPSSNGDVPTQERPIKDFRDAAAAAQSRIESVRHR